MIDRIIVDYKLIHRKTVECFCKEENIRDIIVVSEEGKIDYIERTRIEMSIPYGYNLCFLDVASFFELYKTKYKLEKYLIIFKEICEVVSFVQRGGRVLEVKVENVKIREEDDKHKFFSEKQENDLRFLVSRGINVELALLNVVESL